MTRARSGTSVPSVVTPTQISPLGSCRDTSSDHTNGVVTVMFGMMSRCLDFVNSVSAIGALPIGPTNSMLDIPGVGVGHATVWRDEPDPPEGRGVARTGVTVIDAGG